MDVNQIITLGIGTPSDIPHFLLVGLSLPEEVIFPDVVKARHIMALAASLAVAVEAGAVSGADVVDMQMASGIEHFQESALSGAEFVDGLSVSIARNVQVR